MYCTESTYYATIDEVKLVETIMILENFALHQKMKHVRYVVYLVEGSHGGGGGREGVVDEEEEGVLGPEADPLADEEVELADGEVGRHEVLLLVEVAQPRLRGLLHDHGHAVRVFSP